MRSRFAIACFVASLVFVTLTQNSARGDQYFDYGMTLLKKRDFAGAMKYFDQRLKAAPSDDKALYYKALCYHYTGDKGRARQLYDQIVEKFPGTESARFAAAAIEKMAQGLGTGLSKTPSAAVSSAATQYPGHGRGQASIPKETRVYFRMDGNSIMIPGKINGREFEFCFDTGAHHVLVKKEDFDRAQLHIPENAANEEGVGIGGKIKTKEFDADVTIGSITKRVPISVTEGHTPDNLLGQTWLGDTEYEFDHKSNYITFRPPRAHDVAAAKDNFAVPFTLQGKHLFVEISVPGGRRTKMCVDTGAESIMLTQKNFNDLGLSIPDASSRGTSIGVGGSKRGHWNFIVDEIRLGNIIVRDVPVTVTDDAEGGDDDIDFGLLGMTFFSGWRYTVDNKNQVLRFFH